MPLLAVLWLSIGAKHKPLSGLKVRQWAAQLLSRSILLGSATDGVAMVREQTNVHNSQSIHRIVIPARAGKLLILLFCVFLTARYRSGLYSCCPYDYSPAAAPAPVFAGTHRSLHYQRRQIHHRGSQLHEAAALRPHSGRIFRSFV